MAFDGVIPAGDLKPAPFGLFSVADVQVKGGKDEHWGQGFSAMSEACTFNAKLVDVCGGIPATDVYSADGDRWTQVRPFGILAFDECLSVGWNDEDRRARVTRQLETVTQKSVETEFWSGLYRSQWDTEMDAEAIPLGFLSHEDTTIVEASDQSPLVALALLEQALADCSPGFQGTIHMSPLVAALLGQYLVVDGKQMLTTSGNLVAIGSGYDGRAPGDTTPPASAFVHAMYATGPVHVVLGSKELITINAAQAINAKTNAMTYVAERPAAVYTDGCCQLAVTADIRL